MRKLEGFGRDQKTLDGWAERASRNSQVAPRAKRKMELPSTGKKMELRDTSMKPFEPRTINRKMASKD